MSRQLGGENTSNYLEKQSAQRSRPLADQLRKISLGYCPQELYVLERNVLTAAFLDKDLFTQQSALYTVLAILSAQVPETKSAASPTDHFYVRQEQALAILLENQSVWQRWLLHDPQAQLPGGGDITLSTITDVLAEKADMSERVVKANEKILEEWVGMADATAVTAFPNVIDTLIWFYLDYGHNIDSVDKKVSAVLQAIDIIHDDKCARQALIFCWVDNESLRDLVGQRLKRRLQVLYSFTPAESGEVWKLWLDAAGDEDRDTGYNLFVINLQRQREIEKERSGAVRLLFTKCGLGCLGRYALGILKQQAYFLSAENNKEVLPVRGTRLTSHHDRNTIFANVPWESELDPTVAASDPVLFEYEFSQPLNLLHQLEKNVQRYGKIHFAILSGHGSVVDLFLRASPTYRLTVKLLELLGQRAPTYLQRLRNCFADQAIIVLESCKTGQLDKQQINLAQTLSQWGWTVIGPQEEITEMNALNMQFNRIAKNLSVRPQYSIIDRDGKVWPVPAQCYRNGKHVGTDQTVSITV